MSEPRRYQQGPAEGTQRWIIPALLAVAIVTPILILVLSNTDPATISWAGYRWEAPGWIVLLATFSAGALFASAFGWAWKRWRRRRREEAHARDVLHRRGGE